MLQSQEEPCGGRRHSATLKRNALLQRHPVLLPLSLLSGALIFGITSFFADNIFSLLALVGAPSALMCLLGAFVLGTCGILVSIISALEYLDRSIMRSALFSKSKEHSYDRN